MAVLVSYFVQCLRLRLIAQILRLPSDCVCSALTLYHRYRNVMDRVDNEQRTVAACLFCASKLEETECRTADLLNVVDAVFQQIGVDALLSSTETSPAVGALEIKVMTGEGYYSEKELLIAAEHHLLRAVHFDVVMPHPQRELLTLCTDLCISTGVVSVAVRLMNDTLAYTNLVTMYESGAITASVLYTAMTLANVTSKTAAEKSAVDRRWYEDIGFDVEIVETLGHLIVDMLSEITAEASHLPDRHPI